jgi:VWFA-related protein
MRAVLRTLCGGLALSALILTASAQEPVKLVKLNVVAVDAQGKPVGDLTANDFHIVDEGKPETIALFRAGGFGPTTAVDPSLFTNRPSPPPHTTVVLFDCLNHLRSEWLFAAKKLGTSLKQVQDASSIYFYVLTSGGDLDPIHPLPAAPGAAPNKTWNQDIDALLTKEIKGMKARPMGMADEVVTKKTYADLESLGKQLTSFPGRRDIVWVLGGVPWTYKENTKNPCTGIWVGCGLYAEHLSVYLDLYGTVVNLLTYTDLDTNKTVDMEAMAQLTGGSVTYGNKGGEVAQVIQQLNESAGAGYTIAYDPSSAYWDNKFHVVKIACDRKDVKLIAKTRYYALPDTRSAQDREMDALRTAFQSPCDLSDIGLRAAISPGKTPNTIKVDLKVALSDLVLHESGGKYSAQLTFLLSQRGESGPLGDPAMFAVNPQLTKEQHDAYLKDGFPMSNEYPVISGTKVMRFVVADGATNLAGSLTIPIALP